MIDVVAVQGADPNTAGAVVFWRMSGEVEFDDLECAWSAKGLSIDELPPNVAPAVALQRAMKLFGDGAGSTRVRPIKDTAASYVVVSERFVDDGRPVYTNGMEATLSEDGVLAVTKTDDKTADALNATYQRNRYLLAPHDLSVWLVRLARSVHAVRLRESGGIYFVPRTSLGRWRIYVEAIRACSACTMYEIPAMKTSEAVGAILDALATEVQEAAEDITTALDNAIESKGEVTKRMRNARVRAAQEVERKVAAYESLLGVKLDEIRQRFQVVEARLAMATLQDMGDDL